MEKIRTSIPQGTRDFDAPTVRKRQYIIQIIRQHFERYGFEPLETPALENLDTLMGKYGEEGDRLLFKVLNNGLDDPKNQDRARAAFEQVLLGRNSRDLTERALRYDLTIPLARYVAMNHNQLTLPYRRYQVQPVWRADRPQKGRYREFYQCDADIVGSGSLFCELELVSLYASTFRQLGMAIEIRINHRQILAALAAACGLEGRLSDLTVALDKFEKIGRDKVMAELAEKGLDTVQLAKISDYLDLFGVEPGPWDALAALLGKEEGAVMGIGDLRFLTSFPHEQGLLPLKIDLTLARGLNYYTGVILEVKALGVEMGSIGGGGRYDDLTGLFGVPGIPGVGISFGIDRIYDVMEETGLFPEALASGTQILFFNLGEEESRAAFVRMEELRASGIRCELYHEKAKFDKQFKYAEKKKIRYAVILGSQELERDTCILRDLRLGTQQEIPLAKLREQDFST